MTTAIVILISFFSLKFLYRRYIPVRGVWKIELSNVAVQNDSQVTIVDTRSYQTSFKDAIEQAYCLPLAYLNRHFRDIPNKDVIIVASDHVDKNLSIRLLKRKGIQVVGYYLMR
ncbi:hypothetical protein ACFO3D_09835 [Virgibacillus kekensis]|uniref:Rhodanese domain-containing protein n=1 Tax=Virgibacillus kekensis TaxID=202261 RepID=A0ABV9DI29_9BACI